MVSVPMVVLGGETSLGSSDTGSIERLKNTENEPYLNVRNPLQKTRKTD